MHTTATKLHKIGEFGHGTTTLIIAASRTFEDHHHIDLINKLNSSPKVFLYNLDFDRDDDISNLINELTNTLNKFYFAKNLVLDYPVFRMMCFHSHKIALLKEGLEKLIITNPSKNKNKFTNILGEKINLPELKNTSVSNHFDLKNPKTEIISFEDSKYSMNLASKFKNSRLHRTKSYYEMLDRIIELLN